MRSAPPVLLRGMAVNTCPSFSLNDDTKLKGLMCNIAQSVRSAMCASASAIGTAWSPDLDRSEQLRPAILAGLSDHDVRDEHVFPLFQVF
jgi:hypothetical protein